MKGGGEEQKKRYIVERCVNTKACVSSGPIWSKRREADAVEVELHDHFGLEGLACGYLGVFIF